MSYTGRNPKDLLKSRSIIVKAPPFKDVIPPRMEEELTCFVTRSTLQPPVRQIHWLTTPKGTEKEVVHMLGDLRLVNSRMFLLDHPSNVSNVNESIWNALIRDECIVVTCSLKSLNKLIALVGDDNAYRQYCYDHFGADPGRYINRLHPSFCFPKFDLIVLDPSKIPTSGLTIHHDTRGDKKYVVAEDGGLREFPGNASCPRPRPFLAPGNRPIIYTVNPFLVVLNACNRILDYRDRHGQPNLPPDAQLLYKKTMQLGEAIFWEPSKKSSGQGTSDSNVTVDKDSTLTSAAIGDDGNDDDSDDDDEVKYELRVLGGGTPLAPEEAANMEARKKALMAYGEALMGGPIDHDPTEEDVSLLEELGLSY